MMGLLIGIALLLVMTYAVEYEKSIYDDYYDHDVSGLLEED